MKRLVAAILLSAGSGAIWLYLWWGRFQYHHVLQLAGTYTTVTLLVLGGHFYFGDDRKRLGIRLDNLKLATRWYGILTLLACAAVVLAGLKWGSFRLDRRSDIYVYLFWSALQQYGLQNFLRVRSEDLVSPRPNGDPAFAGANSSARHEGRTSVLRLFPAAVLASGLFALYHLPNHRLVFLSFVGALIWCFSYARVPNFFGAWLSQAVITFSLLMFFKYNLLGQFQIGYPGHRYQSYGRGVQVAAGYDSRGEPVIVTIPAPAKDASSWIRVFDARGQKHTEWVAFDDFHFSGNVAVGDLGFGPGDEVAVTPGPAASNPPVVRIFDMGGTLLKEFAGNITGGYGASISIQCGQILLSPGPGPYSRAEIFAFTPAGELKHRWEFPPLDLQNGVRAAAWCAERPGVPSTQAATLLLWGTPLPTNPSTLFLFDPARLSLSSWQTFSTTFGLNATPLRLAGGKQAVAVSPGAFQGYPAQVQVFDQQGNKLRDFLAYKDQFSCGSHIASVDVNGDREDELVLGEGTGPRQPFTVRIVRLDGVLLSQWDAYPAQ